MPRRRQQALASATPKRTRALKKFTLFPKLPSELRLRVWGFALLQERVIEVLYEDDEDQHIFFTDTPPPPLLSTCHESRREALDVYDVMKFPHEPHPKHRPSFYINYDLDTLLFSRACMSRDLAPEYAVLDILIVQDRLCDFLWDSGEDNTSKIQNVAFACDSRDPTRCLITMGICQCHTHMRGLKKIVLLHGDHCCSKVLRHQSQHSKAVAIEIPAKAEWQKLYGKFHEENAADIRALITLHNQTHIDQDEADPALMLDPSALNIVLGRIVREM